MSKSKFPTVPITELNEKLRDPILCLPLVLVVDGEESVADTRAAILQSWGYAVLIAYDAESALETARLIPPDVLVSDIALQKTNGVELAMALKRNSPDCHVILSCSPNDARVLLAAAHFAGQGFETLEKPVHPRHLWSSLDALRDELKPTSHSQLLCA